MVLQVSSWTLRNMIIVLTFRHLNTVGILLAYTACTFVSLVLKHMLPTSYWVLDIAMFILYTVAPLLYRLASSAYFNLSLLSSDFYGLLFG
jgi:hypothetical protein